MEQHHRNIILENIERLVRDTDLDSVRDTLLRKGVFNNRMAEMFQSEAHDPTGPKRRMFQYVETRGPHAFPRLMETLMETGHLLLARLLDPSCDPEVYLTAWRSHGRDGIVQPGDDDEGDASTPRRCHPSILPQYMINENPSLGKPVILNRTSMINVGTEPRPIRVKLATKRLDVSYHPELHVYPMGSHPKGLALLINNVEFVEDMHSQREGAKVDEDNLQKLFTQLGYKVTTFQNLGRQDMITSIKEFGKRKELRHVCSLVVVMMSHGHGGSHNNAQIIGSDGGHLDTSWILEQFSSSNCPDMIKKPKIFIFQACEGKALDFGVQVSDDGKRTQADGHVITNTRVRSLSDILVANSTLPGYVSHRDKFLGTWFVQAICEVFMEYACSDNIEDMLKMVDLRLSQLRSEHDTIQTSCYKSMGFQKFFFNPGLYDDAEIGNTSVEALATIQTEVAVEAMSVEVTESYVEFRNGNSQSHGL